MGSRTQIRRSTNPKRKRKDRPTEHNLVQAPLIKHAHKEHPDAFVFGRGHDNVITYRHHVNMEAKEAGETSGLPDFWVEDPRRGYGGLRLELKKPGFGPFHLMPRLKMLRIEQDNKEGQHLRNQAFQMHRMNQIGKLALFAEGIDEAKLILDWYFDTENRIHIQFETYDFMHTERKKRYIPDVQKGIDGIPVRVYKLA